MVHASGSLRLPPGLLGARPRGHGDALLPTPTTKEEARRVAGPRTARGALRFAKTLMVLFGIPVESPESLEIQAIVMKLMAIAAIAAALNYWSLIDGRVAVMLVGGAAGASAAWLLGFRQGRGRVAVVVQAIAAGVAALAAELAWRWL